MTGMVLGIGALVGNLTVPTVQDAMTNVTTTAVWNWCRSQLGATVQSVRQKLNHAFRKEQKQKMLCLQTG
jgi:hypothetical protein